MSAALTPISTSMGVQVIFKKKSESREASILRHRNYRKSPEGKRIRVLYAKKYAKTINGRDARYRANLKRYSKHVDFINEIKLRKGCLLCGYKAHPAALDFDHRDRSSKLFSIGAHKGRVSKDVLILEIEKCDILCAICHRIKSFENRDSVAEWVKKESK